MSNQYDNLPEDKKKKIIQACLEEFATHGYKNTSTNTIVKKAGVSKGILFHYFGNKKSLFLYVFDYIVEYLTHKVAVNSEPDQRDIFEKVLERVMLKIRLVGEEPQMSKILMDVFIDMPEELKEDMMERYDKLTYINRNTFMENIDRTKFRKGIDPEKIIEFIVLAFEGIGNKYQKMYKDRTQDIPGEHAAIVEEIKEYIEMMKFGIYEKNASK